MIDTLLQFKDLMTGSEDSKISKDKKSLNEQIKKGKSIKNLKELKSGDLKPLPKSEKQIKNKGKKKLQDAFDNNPDDLPRNLKIDTTTNSSGTVRKFKMGGQSEACGCASCMGESARGGGAAIRGMNFKGVF